MPDQLVKSPVVTISTFTIVKVALALLVLWALYLVADVVVLVVAALLLAAALDPWVDTLQKHYHIPRAVSMLAIYVLLFAVLSSAVVLILPPVIDEVGEIAKNFPALATWVSEWLDRLRVTPGANPTETLQSFTPAVTAATQGVFSFVAGVFGGLVSFLLVLVMTFYLVVDEGSIKRTVAVAPKHHQARLAALLARVQKKLGVWFRAQLSLMGIIAILTYLVLTVIGFFTDMRYALVLALIAGILEFIPYLGPLIAAVPAVFLAFAVSPSTALVVAAAYYLIQLFENNVLVPKIMERALGLSPIVSIVVFLVGAKLAGVAGAFLAIPVATAAMVIAHDVVATRNADARGEA
jgi:predicted PurR-regulated permease PerM